MKSLFIFTLFLLFTENIALSDDKLREESRRLTHKSWEALKKQDYSTVHKTTGQCISLFSDLALEQQDSLKNFPQNGHIKEYWALNHVATCCFIKGKAFREQGRKQKALDMFNLIMSDYSYAQCWDPIGWYWKISEGARDQIIGLKMNIDFGNATSIVLRRKAIETFENGEYTKSLIYISKCLDLYGKLAKDMQKTLSNYAPREKAYSFYALNDVAMCLLIKGKILIRTGQFDQAEKTLLTLLNNYSFAQFFLSDTAQFIHISQLAEEEFVHLRTQKLP